MIFPTATDVVRRAAETLESVVISGLPDIKDRSSATTIVHLLNLVAIRLENEGQLFYDELARLRSLFLDISAYLTAGPGVGPEATELQQDIERALRLRRDPEVYPTLSALAVEVNEGRDLIVRTLALLRAGHAADTSETNSIRSKLQAYVAWQISQEGKLIAPAFQGKGPRR